MAAAVALALGFPDRHDWAAHVLAGGAVVLGVDGVLGPRLGRWTVAVGGLATLVAGVVTELTLTGPFDPADLAITVGGALLLTGDDRRRGRSPAVVGWSVALLAVALFVRYGIRTGP